MVHEEYPPLGLIGVGDRGLGEYGERVLYPLDDDDVGRVLLKLLGHGEQRGLIQSIPPHKACRIQLHCNRGDFGPPVLCVVGESHQILWVVSAQ